MIAFPVSTARGGVAGEGAVGDNPHDRARSALFACIERLERLIERETEALETFAPIDFEDFNTRKTHALLEFSRAARAFAGPASDAIEAKLAGLRVRLERNSSLLAQHLEAMREISQIMIETIERAESDGTYSNRHFANRRV